MGQAVSSGNIPSIFTWSSDSPRSNSSSSNECRDCGNIPDPTTEVADDRQLRKNFNSFSCFRSYDTSEETVKINFQNNPVISESPQSNQNINSEMPSSKKCYSFPNNGDEENGDFCGDNSSVCRHNIQTSKNESSEINGNEMNPIQSCSFTNSNLQKSGGTSTSINRYVSAFTERIEKMSLDDEIKDNNSGSTPKLTDFKRTSKQKKNNFRECNGCSKESKNNNKLGAKKKNTWMRFYGSKLTKGNNGKQATNSNPSPSEMDSACVCTSYKKVDDNNKQENEPSPSDPVKHPWQPPEGTNQNTSNWSLVTGTSNMLYNIRNRENNCISCEGSHCHLEWNALADLSNIRRLPINITVTRVGSNNDAQNSPGGGENNLILLSLGSQRPFDSRMRSDEYTEDCDVRARLRRAFEIDEGIEIPPNAFNSPQFQVVSTDELRALLFQQQIPASATFVDRANPRRGRIHTQVDYIHCLVPDLRSITGCSFYWGKMDRYEAERLLDGKPEGTFLLRDSAQEEYLFSVSFRKYQRSLHARIEQFNHKFSFDSHDPAVFASDTVTGLIEHYKDPTCVMFFEPMLTAPLSRTFTFPLQHLCRAVIVSCTTYDGINELRLPPGIKAYLKEYHYRQRVRVKRFDVSPESSEESQ